MSKGIIRQKPTIVLIDDHILLRKGLASLLNKLGFNVIFEADNGKDFIEKLEGVVFPPDIAMLDINMPVMDGYETAAWIKSNQPSIKILALTMHDNEMAIIKMLQLGVRGYLLKDCEPKELKNAIATILKNNFYYSELVNSRLIETVNKNEQDTRTITLNTNLSEREITFMKYACSDLGYREIAVKMNQSTRTIEGYRDSLFRKLEIKSRAGLVIYAIKNQLVIIT